MKKLFIFLNLFITYFISWSQTLPLEEVKITPNGYFEDVFDRFGNKYDIKDLQVGKDFIKDQTLSKTVAITCDTGIFELYFETGCGMENTADAAHNARRDVVCRVFKDLSDFINTPLKNAGNTTKVKIWVRNGANIGMPSNALGTATSFYTKPYSIAYGNIIDGEVYKTIQGGKDSFINTLIPPLYNDSNNLYHGMMAFNFNNLSWNTNLLANSVAGQYDLYSVVLHEVTHALGFNSMLRHDGSSVINSFFNYYSRYDKFLYSGAQPLITNTGSCSSMYDYNFNSSLSASVLTPGCTSNPPTSNTSTNNSVCLTAINFLGTNSIPVYTPICFESGSSFSHFEDMCIPSPNTGNDTYFVMSNANGTGSQFLKRFLKSEERNALLDIGYSLKTTYGNNATVLSSFINYGGSIVAGTDVQGINDGVNNFGIYTFMGNPGQLITISGILTNDYNAVSFECLQDIKDSSAIISNNSGTASTSVNFSSNIVGLHLLRYIPVNPLGKKGNVTYVYVYINNPSSCAISTNCNLVLNGDFEQYSNTPNSLGEIEKACGWQSLSNNSTPDYMHQNSSIPQVAVPCNFVGYENDNIINNKGYAGLWLVKNWTALYNIGEYNETLKTRLKNPLEPNKKYKLEFELSLAEGASSSAIKLQAYLSKNPITISSYGSIPVDNPNMLLNSDNFSTISNGWQKNTIQFTTDSISGEEYLYLGVLNNAQYVSIIPSVGVPGCNNNIGMNVYPETSYYFIDNIKLIEISETFDLPASVCNNVTLSNLSSYILPAPIGGGTFSGNGVVNNSGVYSFNAATAGVGTHTITYTYNNSSGCQESISDTIEVVNTNTVVPSFTQIDPVCLGITPSLPTTSSNGVVGSWSLISSNATTMTYTFTPNSGQCASATPVLMIIGILPSNDPSCVVNTCQNTIVLSSPEVNNIITYRALNSIETNTNYVVSTGKQVTFKSENTISLKPNTYINSGSTFWAKIQPCSDTSKQSVSNAQGNTKNESLESNVLSNLETLGEIKLYPNPSDSNITIESLNAKTLAVSIFSLDGKTLFQKSANNDKMDIDVSAYKHGMYMVEIKTDNNQIKKVKFIKQ